MKRIVLFLLCVAAAVAQPTQTTITDTLYNPASNALLEGTIRIELMTGGATSNQAHVFGERTLTITSGALSLTLPPNSTMSPSGSYYRVTKSLRPAGTSERYRVSTVTWTVPTSATCSGGVCRVADIESITAPTPSGTINISRLTSSCAENQTFVWNGFNFACSNVLGANPMEAVGDMLYGNSSGVLRRLAGNTTTTRKYLLSVGDGSTAKIPAWTQPAASDLSNGTTGSGNVVLATSPTITSATISGSLTGNASTATALAANGSNCSAGQFPLGVDASGAAESCTALPTTIAGTANQITASASTGAVTLSLPSTITGLTSVTSTSFVGALTGNASTATALAANPADCSANQYATGIAASGDLTCAQPAASNLSNGTTGTGSIVLASSPTIVTPTIASFANATHSHQNAAGGGTLAGASALSDYSTAFVTSITGTANQVIRSASVGAITLSLPQDIHTAATPTFGGMNLSAESAGNYAVSANIASGGGGGSGDHGFVSFSKGATSQWMIASPWNGGTALEFIDSTDYTSKLILNKSGQLTLYNGSTLGVTTLVVKEGAGQSSSSPFIVQNNAGALIAEITSAGHFSTPGSIFSTYASISNPSATNDVAATRFILSSGSDGTLGALYLSFAMRPSATGSNRYVTLQAGDNSAYRLIALQPNGGNVSIGTTTDDGSSKLQVAGTATAYSATVYNPTAVTGSSSLVVRAGAGQSGALQAWQNNAGTAMSYISTVGEFRLQDNTTNYVGVMNRSGGTDNGDYGLYLNHTAESASIYAGSSKTVEVKKDKVGFFGVTPVARAAAPTTANASALNTGDATSDAVIGNMRTRLGEVITALQNLGLLN